MDVSRRAVLGAGGSAVAAGLAGCSISFGQGGGQVHSLSRANGSEHWVYTADAGIQPRRPVVTGSAVVVTTE